MLVLLSYAQSSPKIPGTLQVAANLESVFGVRLHCLQLAEPVKGVNPAMDKPLFHLSNAIRISEHRVTRITKELALSYLKAIRADLVILELDDHFLIEKEARVIMELVKEYNLPVLLLTNNFNEVNLKNVLLIVDAEYFGLGLQIDKLKQFLSKQKANIHLLHIFNKKETEDVLIEQMKFFATVHNIHVASMHSAMPNEAEAIILKLCKKVVLDLICIRTQGTKHRNRLQLGQVDKVFTSKLNIPVLIFHLKYND